MEKSKLEKELIERVKLAFIDGREIEIEDAYKTYLNFTRNHYKEYNVQEQIKIMNKYAQWRVRYLKDELGW